MDNSPSTRIVSAAFIGLSAAFAVPFVAALSAYGWIGLTQTRVLVELGWIAPVAQAFMILSALSLSILLMGRHRVLGGAWAYWSGMAFAVNAVFGIFYLLSWPGLMGERGSIVRLPNTAIWFAFLASVSVTLQFAAVSARRPERSTPRVMLAGYACAVAVAVLTALAVVVFEGALPVLFDSATFNGGAFALFAVLAVFTAAGGVSAWRRCREEDNPVLGYVALFIMTYAYGLFYSIMGRKRYDIWWYGGRAEVVLSYMLLHFGLLQEGYRLFSGERALSEERTQLLRQLDARTRELEFHGALLQAQQESSLDGMLIVDEAGGVISHNRRIVEQWGIPREVLDSKRGARAVRSVLSKLADPAGFVFRVRHLNDHRDENSLDVIVLRDGRTLEQYSSPVFGVRKQYYGRIFYFRDITARMRAENALRERTEQLSRSNGDLAMYAHTVSHDLVAPLSKISFYSEILLERAAPKLEDKDRDFLERIQKTSVGMAKMLRDVLAMSRVGHETDPIETVDWKRVLGGVLSDLELVVAQAGATITMGEMPRIRAQETLFRQLFLNLIANAVKFRDKKRSPRIEVGGRTTESGVEVFVRDNGIGFSQKSAEDIFNPFVRLNPDVEDHGIGLTTCRRIAQRLGGRLTAEGIPGEGATFTLWLPRGLLERP